MNRLILALAAVLCIAAAPATTQTSPRATTATRVITVKDRSIQFPDDDALVALHQHAQQLGEQLVGPSLAKLGKWFDLVAQRDETLGIVIDLTGDRWRPNQEPRKRDGLPAAVAADIADEMVRFTRDYIVNQDQARRDEALKRAIRAADESLAAANDAEARLRDLRQKLRDVSGRADVAPSTLTGAMSSMDQELQHLQLDRLSKESRRHAVEEELAKVSERVQHAVKSDAIAHELQKVVDAREERVKTIQKMAGSNQATTSEVSDAIAQAAEARAKMLQQQRDAAAAAGGNILEKFNLELISLSIDSRELDAKVKYLQDGIARLRAAVELLDNYRRISEDASRSADTARKATTELQQLRRAQDDQPQPRVLVRESQNSLVE